MPDKFVFRPWHDYAMQADEVTKIPIEEPPCKHCKKWNPRITTDQLGKYAGVSLCGAKEMYHDFSCFKEKEGESK